MGSARVRRSCGGGDCRLDGGRRKGAGDVVDCDAIKHLVVIFQENVSFDHYFGTYPKAANTDGQKFAAAPGTPSVDGLTQALLTSNPNASQPQRLEAAAPRHVHLGNYSAYLSEIEVEASRAWDEYELLVIPGLELTYNDLDRYLAAHAVALGCRAFVGEDPPAVREERGGGRPLPALEPAGVPDTHRPGRRAARRCLAPPGSR